MHIFDMKNEKWLCLFEELNSPVRTGGQDTLDSPKKRSPTLKKEKLAILAETGQKEMMRSNMKNKT